MKRVLGILFLAAVIGCSQQKDMEVTVTNALTVDRVNEVVEIAAVELSAIKAKYGEEFILVDADGAEVGYQVTYDNKLIFPATVATNEKAVYTVKAGAPKAPQTVACGKYYPERVDDIAWENDRIAFRAYGPALQATGERAFGYDVWAKRVAHPVVEARYAKELNPETLKQIAELRKTDRKGAQELANSVSYHVDHGDGLDYYSVGPTLGGGTAALMVDGEIVYPYAYKTYEILDNGPLRFTVSLTYNPLTVRENDNVVETRLLSLDAGSQMNRVTVRYKNLKEATPVATGLVMHEPSDVYKADAAKGFIAYADPKDETNGQLYVGAVVPAPRKLTVAEPVYFSDEEKKDRKANGHLLAVSAYNPGDDYTYYFGGGWSKWGFATPEAWFTYVEQYAERVNSPLQVTVK